MKNRKIKKGQDRVLMDIQITWKQFSGNSKSKYLHRHCMSTSLKQCTYIFF